jgi:hypothetical protein
LAIEAMTRKYTKRTKPFPLALTEFNVVNGSVPPTLELVNGLFMAEVLGEAIDAGYLATNYWDWKNGYEDKHGGGDHAMLASKDPRVTDDTPRPSYYAYALYAKAFGDHLVESKSSDSTVKVYASTFKDKPDVGLVLVNETQQAARVMLQHVGHATSLTGWVLTGPALNSRAVTFNGEPGPASGGGPFPIDGLEHYTKDLGGADDVEITLPPISASGVVLRSAPLRVSEAPPVDDAASPPATSSIRVSSATDPTRIGGPQ